MIFVITTGKVYAVRTLRKQVNDRRTVQRKVFAIDDVIEFCVPSAKQKNNLQLGAFTLGQ